MFRIVTLVVSIAMLSGCAAKVRHDYTSPQPQLMIETAAPLSVGTQDLRPYIVGRSKGPNFVGLSRGGFGNPFDVRTSSGKPLAADFSKVVTSALRAKGIQAEAVWLSPDLDRQAVSNTLFKAADGKALLITLYEWKTDTSTVTTLIYNIKAEVLARNGTVLAENVLDGHDNLGGSAFNPPAHSRAATPQAFRMKLEQLLNDPRIVRALR